MDWIFALAAMTFALVIAYLVWNRVSVSRNQKTGNATSGIGGPNDPLAGANPAIRSPDAIRSNLDEAALAADQDSRPLH